MSGYRPRPGRKMGKERRRLAKAILRGFYVTEGFEALPQTVKLAITELCPVELTCQERKEERERAVQVQS